MSRDAPAPGSPDPLLRALVDHLPSMLAYWDTELRCRFANRAYERWFGVSPEALLGKHIRELLGPLYERNLPYMQRALRGEPQQFEREIPDPAGGPSRHSLANYTPDVVDGVVRGFFVLVTDISEIKRAQLALEQSEASFSRTIDEAPIGMALVALDGHFIRVNRVLCELLGYAPEELRGLTFQAITHPEDLDADLALAGQLARGELQRYQLEKRYLRKDGAVVDILLSGSAVRGRDGALLHFVAQIQDITERKRREREQRFLAEVGPVLAASLDYEETLTRVAELAVRDLADLCIVDLVEDGEELRRLKVTSRDPSKAWVCESLQKVSFEPGRAYLLQPVVEGRRPLLLAAPSAEQLASMAQSEEHLRALEGAEIRSMVAVPLLVRERLLGSIAFISSSASRRYGPGELRLAQELAQQAALAIENARLYREARRATQLRDEVLGIVAHDLRNPLNAIVLQAKTLRGSPEEGAQGRSLKSAEAIERAATRMNHLIQDLLDVTSMEAGRLSVEQARVSAAQLVSECAEAQRPLAAAAGLTLRLELEGQLPELWADRGRLQQVFENLIGNALKFTPPGGTLTMGAAPRGAEVLFRVSDTGSGIGAGDLPHLFDRFWQAGKGQRHGAGLGLPIVKGIIEAHGGRIWVQSSVGQGSTFFFTVPTAPP